MEKIGRKILAELNQDEIVGMKVILFSQGKKYIGEITAFVDSVLQLYCILVADDDNRKNILNSPILSSFSLNCIDFMYIAEQGDRNIFYNALIHGYERTHKNCLNAILHRTMLNNTISEIKGLIKERNISCEEIIKELREDVKC